MEHTPEQLATIVYTFGLKYTTFEVDKKSGGKRTIKAPVPKLKVLQQHLAYLLYQCLEEIERERNARPISFGFRKNRSITENASHHKGKRWIFNLDLKDFFPSFNFGRVRGFFLKDRAFALHPEVATTIAQIACDGVALPQGSPCSPVISELIAQILDMRLVRLAKKHNVTYTRYADDITFSTRQKNFPTELATVDPRTPVIWYPGGKLADEITRAGFTINATKTRMHFRGSRQMVTGLVVNEKVNIRSDYYRRARAMCDMLFQKGRYYKFVIPPDSDNESPQPDLISNLNPLHGILNHIYSVTQTTERRDVTEQRQKPRAIRKLFRRFLFYKYCIALQEPLIITEGKTDPVYLREAVKSRTGFHPILGAPSEDGFQHAVRYFNYGRLASEVMDINGGTGDLKSILTDYLHNFTPPKGLHKPFKNGPMQHPVIIVLDNDKGLAPITKMAQNIFKITINKGSNKDFYHITENLFIVIIPEKNSKDTSIEDLFPSIWRNHEINGKRLNTSNKINPANDLSKEAFAKRVVLPNASKIDFSGFDPLLKRIEKVIRYYTPPTIEEIT